MRLILQFLKISKRAPQSTGISWEEELSFGDILQFSSNLFDKNAQIHHACHIVFVQFKRIFYFLKFFKIFFYIYQKAIVREKNRENKSRWVF